VLVQSQGLQGDVNLSARIADKADLRLSDPTGATGPMRTFEQLATNGSNELVVLKNPLVSAFRSGLSH